MTGPYFSCHWVSVIDPFGFRPATSAARAFFASLMVTTVEVRSMGPSWVWVTKRI